jgi:hypothetical protein
MSSTGVTTWWQLMGLTVQSGEKEGDQRNLIVNYNKTGGDHECLLLPLLPHIAQNYFWVWPVRIVLVL